MLGNVRSPVRGFFRRHSGKMLVGAIISSAIAAAVIFTGGAELALFPATKALIIAGSALVGGVVGAIAGCEMDRSVDVIVFEPDEDESLIGGENATYRRYRDSGLVIERVNDNENSFLNRQPLLPPSTEVGVTIENTPATKVRLGRIF